MKFVSKWVKEYDPNDINLCRLVKNEGHIVQMWVLIIASVSLFLRKIQ